MGKVLPKVIILWEKKTYLSSCVFGNAQKLRDFCKVIDSQNAAKYSGHQDWGSPKNIWQNTQTIQPNQPSNQKILLTCLSRNGAVWD